jgi:DNA-binding MarR family transcriptional regulator
MVSPYAEVRKPRPAPDSIYLPEAIAKGATTNAPSAVALSTPQSFVHCMLFVLEYLESPNPRMQKHKKYLSFFFSRSGGFHLLLMLLNAYYNKPLAGRDPGWVFRGIRNRIPVSERALRMLINDGMAQGLIVQQHGVRDRRCRKYAVTPAVVEAWEALTNAARGSLPDIFNQFGPGALANADYRRWDPTKPAGDQVETIPPSHQRYR